MKYVSIVIPTYNEEKHLPVLLKQLQNQDFNGKYEIIVVDNNSTDKTFQIAKSFNTRVVKESRQGITYARYRGLLSAKGEIIVQTDADCLVDKNWLSQITKPFFKDDDVILTHGVSYPSKIEIGIRSHIYYSIILFLKFLLQKTTLMCSGYNLAYKKDIALKIMKERDYLDLSYYEDTYLAFKIGKLKGKKIYVPQAKVITSTRRIEKESLKNRISLWGYSMIYYSVFRKFPIWTYRSTYLAHR